MASSRPSARARWGALVLPHLPDDHWIKGVELQQLTGLKYQQVVDGIGFLRDEHPDFPLVSKPFKGYRYSVDPRDVREFQQWRVATSFTIMRRAYWGAIAPYLKQLPLSAQRRTVRRNFERALEDLGDLITLSA